MAASGIHRHKERQFTAHQKAGQITVFLVQGSQLSTVEIAQITGMTYMGAKYMLEMLSLVLPIEYSEKRWRWMARE